MAPAHAQDKPERAGDAVEAAHEGLRENSATAAECRPGGGEAAPAGRQSPDQLPGELPGQLFEFTELLFFAYRDFIGEPDEILTSFGFGRAHHRVLHFVSRHPGIRVANLLSILKITKQSLARVLRQLIEEGYIEQRESREDRRRRLLFATPRGADLAARLAAPQLRRIAEALAAAGEDARAPAREFLYNLINESDRAEVRALIAGKRVE